MSPSTGANIAPFSQQTNDDIILRNNSDLIYWDHNDAENPFNFPKWKKAMICALVCMHTSMATMCSSNAASFAQELQEEFNVTPIVSRLPVAMYLFGLAIGPVILTPLAEAVGYEFLGIFSRSRCPGSACVRYIFYLLLWTLDSSDDRGAYINQALGWRWVFGIWGIVGAALMLPFLFLVPETRAGVILTARAQRARGSGRPHAWTIYEKEGHRSFHQILTETILRPAVMLLTEPIVYCFALYDGLNYAIIYLAVEAVPLIYARYGVVEPKVEVTFVAMQIGFTVAIPFFYFQLKATKWQEKRQGKTDVPENKLLWAFPGQDLRVAHFRDSHVLLAAAILFPISMYWFAWTAVPSVNIYSSLGALVVFGISGHITVSDYTVESYGPMASSAVTGQSFARENICGLLALVGVYFYENVGFQWASTILAILATLMGLFPFLFYRYGPVIRRKSRYAQELARLEEEERQRLKALEMEFNKTLE
ncbi:hypothetical protein H0H92_001151 [Tricholoma furcatifolium]|nr:hypothetical protein H0H92_001151 [Tricholoma furcatifolium]